MNINLKECEGEFINLAKRFNLIIKAMRCRQCTQRGNLISYYLKLKNKLEINNESALRLFDKKLDLVSRNI